jgi:PAS domain S-box-containing protein
MSAISTLALLAALVGFVLFERADINTSVDQTARVESLVVSARELSLFVQYTAHDVNAYMLGHLEHRKEFGEHIEQFKRTLREMKRGATSDVSDREERFALYPIGLTAESYDRTTSRVFQAADLNRRAPTPKNQARLDAEWTTADGLGDQLDRESQLLARALRTKASALQAQIDGRNEQIIFIVLALAVVIGFLIVLIQSAVGRAKTAAESARRRSENLLARNRLLLDSAGDGIYGLDTEGRISFANPAAAGFTGYTLEELVGSEAHALLHHTRPDGSPYPAEECQIRATFLDGVGHQGSADLYWRKDGTSFPVEYTSTPVTEDGEVQGAVVIFKDVTESRRAAEQLSRSQQLLAQAEELAAIGSWEWDVQTGEVSWSEELYRLSGLDPNRFKPSFEGFMSTIHPDDRSTMAAVIEEVLASHEPFATEYRVVRPDGSVRVANAQAWGGFA